MGDEALLLTSVIPALMIIGDRISHQEHEVTGAPFGGEIQCSNMTSVYRRAEVDPLQGSSDKVSRTLKSA